MARLVFVLSVCCLVGLFMMQEAYGFKGLCSRHWLLKCYDLGDECVKHGGECDMPGIGDHKEACACIDKKTKKILSENHLGKLNKNK